MLLFGLTSCKGQQAKTKETSTESLYFNEPKPEPIDKNLNLHEVYKNCIAFKIDKNIVVLNKRQSILRKGKEFEYFISNHSFEFKKQKIYILYDSTIKYSEIVNLLDLFLTLKIKNFEIVDTDLYLKPEEPLVVDLPKSVAKEIHYDSTDFIITILDNSINIDLLKRTQQLKNPNELDIFIQKNSKSIDPLKIYLKSKASLPYDRFKDVKNILKRHEFYKFKIIVEGD